MQPDIYYDLICKPVVYILHFEIEAGFSIEVSYVSISPKLLSSSNFDQISNFSFVMACIGPSKMICNCECSSNMN